MIPSFKQIVFEKITGEGKTDKLGILSLLMHALNEEFKKIYYKTQDFEYIIYLSKDGKNWDYYISYNGLNPLALEFGDWENDKFKLFKYKSLKNLIPQFLKDFKNFFKGELI